MDIKDYSGHRKRLRDRYLLSGISGFLDYEVLELILNTSIQRTNTYSIAKDLLDKYSSLNAIMNANVEDLCRVKGIGEKCAIQIKLFKDVSTYLKKETILNQDGLTSIKQVIDYLNTYLKGKSNEEFLVIFLNNSNIIQRINSISKGTVNEAKVYVRNIIKQCLDYGSSGIILVHNHPGGSTKPSQSDIDITIKIKKAASYFNIRVLDHFIITNDNYTSFAGENLL